MVIIIKENLNKSGASGNNFGGDDINNSIDTGASLGGGGGGLDDVNCDNVGTCYDGEQSGGDEECGDDEELGDGEHCGDDEEEDKVMMMRWLL